ncbi:hypothetical protein [Altibacter sp.]|uniref:hypothetical protein n=1 Tax=Altibacter sp. TaxID=2024823 RepID=UPI00258519EC|nr:hypothetical protein [Altibacter sp.]MCW8981375.1 hypothetical protein [Altibacter sp.]
MKPSIVKKIKLDFASIEIHQHYMISQIKEGLDFEQPHLEAIYEIFETYFSGRPFVSIADRKNDYTINPNLLKDTRYKNLLGIGVVCYSEASYNNALFEKTFFKGKFEPFYEMEACKEWALQLVEDFNKSN